MGLGEEKEGKKKNEGKKESTLPSLFIALNSPSIFIDFS